MQQQEQQWSASMPGWLTARLFLPLAQQNHPTQSIYTIRNHHQSATRWNEHYKEKKKKSMPSSGKKICSNRQKYHVKSGSGSQIVQQHLQLQKNPSFEQKPSSLTYMVTEWALSICFAIKAIAILEYAALNKSPYLMAGPRGDREHCWWEVAPSCAFTPLPNPCVTFLSPPTSAPAAEDVQKPADSPLALICDVSC